MQVLNCSRCITCAWKSGKNTDEKYFIYDVITGEVYKQSAYIAEMCIYLIKNKMCIVDEKEYWENFWSEDSSKKSQAPNDIIYVVLEKE